MPNRIRSHARPIKASQTATSLSTDGSGSSGGFVRRVFGKARSSLRRNIASFCCLMRSGNRKRFFARDVSGSGFEFTGRLLGMVLTWNSHHTKGMLPHPLQVFEGR